MGQSNIRVLAIAPILLVIVVAAWHVDSNDEDAPVRSRNRAQRPRPAADRSRWENWMADARTFATMVRYLIEPEPSVQAQGPDLQP